MKESCGAGEERGGVEEEEKGGAEEEVRGGAEEKKGGAQKAGQEVERRFVSMNSGAKHVIFIKCSEEVDPIRLVHFMLKDIHTTQIRKSR